MLNKNVRRLTTIFRKRNKSRYLHSDIDTVESRNEQRLTMGRVSRSYRNKSTKRRLDIPEVALVAVLDADKEGFLRSEFVDSNYR